MFKKILFVISFFVGCSNFIGAQEIAMNEPFWDGDTVHGESLLFIKNGDAPAKSKCLFKPTEIIELKSTYKNIVYEQGKDYKLKPNSREIYLTPNSRIKFIKSDSLFPPVGSKNSIRFKNNDKTRGVLFYSRTGFPIRQVEITYKHVSKWDGVSPVFAGDKLPGFYKKLKNHKTARVTIIGDSITTGYNASKIIKIPPYQPAWQALWLQAMRKTFKTSIVYNGKTAPGRTIGWMLKHIGNQPDTNPDLVIIAFGMNDYSVYKSATIFKNILQKMMHIFRNKNPKCEFLLISPMLGNPDWSNTPWPLAFSYLKAMKDFEAPGVVVADLTSLWQDMLKHKDYVSQTGNGVNHPNDFGHRIYAKYLLAMFISKKKKY